MFNAIGYHTYAGGLAVGVARHFDLIGLGEHDGYGNDVKRLNFPGVAVYDTFSQWPKERGRGAKACRFIFSNPPCAPFSLASAGRATAWHEDPRLRFWTDIFGLIPTAEPDILAIESVVPAWTKGRTFIDSMASTAATWGYSTTILLHNARWLGAVQDRKRVFITFHKIAAEWPTPNFDNGVTVRDIFKGIKIPAATRKRFGAAAAITPGQVPLYNHLPNGGHLHNAFNEMYGDNVERNHLGQIKGRPSFLMTRLALNSVNNPVFMGSGHILHPTEPRSLFPEEIAAYTGFPADWKWPEGYPLGKISTLASQGVSPLGGAWLGAGASASIERGRRLNRPDYGIVDGLSRVGWGRGRVELSDDPQSYAKPLTPAQFAGTEPIYADATRTTKVQIKMPDTSPPWDPAPAVKTKKRLVQTEMHLPQGSPAPKTRVGSGVFIREHLKAGKIGDAEILALVHKTFPTSRATMSDISWNKRRLELKGVN